MPAIILSIVSGIELAIKLAPGVVNVVNTARAFIASLFSAGKITIAQQTAIFERLDAVYAIYLAGGEPDAWEVDPDPTGTTMAENTTITVT
jgi:hypothetical protein